MSRRALVALFGIIVVGTLLLLWWKEPTAQAVAWQLDNAGPATVEEATALVNRQGLHCMAYPLQGEPKRTLIVSDQPLAHERLCELRMFDPHFEHWRGIVQIDVQGWRRLQSNCDPAHPERIALWGKLCVYGDPELIAKLRSAR
jgi:hypothetical protein